MTKLLYCLAQSLLHEVVAAVVVDNDDYVVVVNDVAVFVALVLTNSSQIDKQILIRFKHCLKFFNPFNQQTYASALSCLWGYPA